MAIIWCLDYIKCNLITLCISLITNSEAITLKNEITSNIQWGHSPFIHQYAPLLETPKPTPSIPCYNTQANAIKQLLYYQET